MSGFVSQLKAVGATDTAVLAFDNTREMLVVSNDSAQDVWLTLSNSATLKPAVVGVGILVEKTTGRVTIFPPLCQGGMKAISESGSVWDLAASTYRVEDYNKGFGGSRLEVMVNLFANANDTPEKADNLVLSASTPYADGSIVGGVS